MQDLGRLDEFLAIGSFIEEGVNGCGLGGTFEVKDPVDDPGPDGDWVLDGVVIVMLGHCFIMMFILLMNERNGDGISGVEFGSRGDASVVFPENNILDGDDFGSSCAGCL